MSIDLTKVSLWALFASIDGTTVTIAQARDETIQRFDELQTQIHQLNLDLQTTADEAAVLEAEVETCKVLGGEG